VLALDALLQVRVDVDGLFESAWRTWPP
jgi:hypothetical protein